MDVFVARQPILDASKSVYAYELLFRSGPENYFPDCDPDAAASRVITDSASVFGMDSLTAGKRAFVNVTRRVLTEGLFSFLPREWVVVELLETVEADGEVVAACKALKRAGYALALDDFVDRPEFEPLVELADFLKIDFLATDSTERRKIAERYGSRVRLLAEKVETHEDVQEGLELGFELFQGFFFCKPQMVVRHEVPAFKLNYVRFVREIMRSELNLDQLERVIKQEVSLSERLLRLLNSAAFVYNDRVNSVREAIILLGERQVKKWAMMIALSEIDEDGPQGTSFDLPHASTVWRADGLVRRDGHTTRQPRAHWPPAPGATRRTRRVPQYSHRTAGRPVTARPCANPRHRPPARRLGHGRAADEGAGGYRGEVWECHVEGLV